MAPWAPAAKTLLKKLAPAATAWVCITDSSRAKVPKAQGLELLTDAISETSSGFLFTKTSAKPSDLLARNSEIFPNNHQRVDTRDLLAVVVRDAVPCCTERGTWGAAKVQLAQHLASGVDDGRLCMGKAFKKQQQ